MKTAQIIYQGGLRTEATHLASGVKIITDAPVDNHGKGQAFSPTDLMSTSLGSCMMTIMGILAERLQINLTGTKIDITKIMAQNPRRVGEIVVEVQFPQNNFDQKTRDMLEHAARTCPVELSLGADVKRTITFLY